MRYVTAKFLKESGACPEQRRVFSRVFGTRAAITLKNAKRAEEACLSANWLAHCWLNSRQKRSFGILRSEFRNRRDAEVQFPFGKIATMRQINDQISWLALAIILLKLRKPRTGWTLAALEAA